MADIDEVGFERELETEKPIKLDSHWTEELINIKGIGEETIKDIKVIYKTKEDLISDLVSDRNVPLINSQVKILKKILIK